MKQISLALILVCKCYEAGSFPESFSAPSSRDSVTRLNWNVCRRLETCLVEIGHRLETHVVDEQSTNKVLEQDSFRESFINLNRPLKPTTEKTCLKKNFVWGWVASLWDQGLWVCRYFLRCLFALKRYSLVQLRGQCSDESVPFSYSANLSWPISVFFSC